MSAPREEDTPWTPEALRQFRRRFPNSPGPAPMRSPARSPEPPVADLEPVRKPSPATDIRTLRNRLLELEGLKRRIGKIEEAIGAQLIQVEEVAVQISRRRITRREIMKHVSEYTRVRPEDIKGPRRQRGYAEARQACMYLARKWCPTASLPEIGRWLGGRDHSTVLHGVRKVENNMELFADIIAHVEGKLSTQAANNADCANNENQALHGGLSTCHQQGREVSAP